MDWLRQMVGLPAEFVGSIQDTASTATLVALLSAREHASKGVTGLQGMSGGPALTVYASREAHSSVDKGVKLAGYGLERLRRIATDAAYGMDPAALEREIERDLAAGLRPACVVASIGTTSSTAVDPVAEDRGDLPPPRDLAPRGRRLRGLGRDRPGAARPIRGLGAGRQHRAEPAQVAADQLRLHRLLRARPGRAALGVQSHAGIPPDRPRRAGGELSGLGHPARPAVPRAQAVVRDPQLRCRGAPGDHPSTRRAGGRAGELGGRGARLRAAGAGAVRAGVLSLPAAGRRGGGAGSAQRAAVDGGERARGGCS